MIHTNGHVRCVGMHIVRRLKTDAVTVLHNNCYYHAAVLLKKLIVAQTVKKFSAFYRTKKVDYHVHYNLPLFLS